jgi:hypothetical protein
VVYNVVYKVYNVLCNVYNVVYNIHNLIYNVYNVQNVVCNVVYNVCNVVCNVYNVVYNAYIVVYKLLHKSDLRLCDFHPLPAVQCQVSYSANIRQTKVTILAYVPLRTTLVRVIVVCVGADQQINSQPLTDDVSLSYYLRM